jgi:hypothetical protein
MYRITDNFGTNRTAWTWAGALEWLACCSDCATVHNRFTGRLLASRHQPNF